jgi:hypothetical protein
VRAITNSRTRIQIRITNNDSKSGNWQKKKKEVKKFDQLPHGVQPQQLTQNNVYVGSTTDLQRMLAAKMKKAPEVIDDNSNED